MKTDLDILIAGLGSAGCKFLDTCIGQQEVAIPRHIAIHTDQQTLDLCRAEEKFLLGATFLRGDSTGGDQNLGQQATEQDRSVISEYFLGADIIFLVTGLGGGTGTGAAPLLAGWAREQGSIVICFAIQPFFFEGNQKRMLAEGGLRELSGACDAVVQLSNQNIHNWANEHTGVQDAFEKVNTTLLHNLAAMIDLLSLPGIMGNVSFTDFEAMLQHSSGACVMGYGEGEGESRVEDALSAVVSNPILGKENIIGKASGLIVGIIGGPDMTVFELQRIMEAIPAIARSDARLSMGAVVRSNWRQRIGVAVFATEKWEESPALPPDGANNDLEDPEKRAEKKTRQKQSKLSLEPRGKGFFNGIEPTYHDGNDIDVPTFQRKNIKLV